MACEVRADDHFVNEKLMRIFFCIFCLVFSGDWLFFLVSSVCVYATEALRQLLHLSQLLKLFPSSSSSPRDLIMWFLLLSKKPQLWKWSKLWTDTLTWNDLLPFTCLKIAYLEINRTVGFLSLITLPEYFTLFVNHFLYRWDSILKKCLKNQSVYWDYSQEIQ